MQKVLSRESRLARAILFRGFPSVQSWMNRPYRLPNGMPSLQLRASPFQGNPFPQEQVHPDSAERL
ncbi:hypothetical protein EVA_07160 [gut metagenome]|uniref:Uncharacterized protein n=1 Tax=gut metagenome TaxID=749906 RepID=J9GVW7_9ZZZZ